MEHQTINKYDRLYGSVVDVGLSTKASTIRTVEPITGKTESFIVQTCRHQENGDYVFIEHVSEDGVVRLALPPKVANLIASQRDALSKRRRSISSKAVMRARMESGEVIGFQKRKAGGQ
jgi:hypothetical protein